MTLYYMNPNLDTITVENAKISSLPKISYFPPNYMMQNGMIFS